MPETKNIRLAVAAREFNVGTATIVEHLEAKGYEIANRPTSRLTEEMYNILVKEFHKDKGIKERADQINLGTKKREDVSLKSEPKQTPKKEDKKEVLVQSRLAGAEAEPAAKPAAAKPAAPVAPPAPVTPPPPVEEKPAPVAEKPAEPVEKKPATAEPAAAESKPAEKAKVELDGPKVVGKVDLDSQKKKPAEKPKQEKPAEKPKVAASKPKQGQPAAKKAWPAKPAPKVKTPKPEAEMIETKRVQLDGPKVMGKIELPKPKERESGDAKKKRRKRIIKTPPGRPGGAPGGANRGPGGPNRGPGGPNRGPGGRGPGRGAPPSRGRKPQVELSEKEIQEKIKNTLAKLSGASKGKSSRAKMRRAKREDHAQREDEALAAQDTSVLQVTEFISVAELATLMGVSSTEVISTCMGLGIIVSINQRLDAEVIELVSDEFGFKAEFINVSEREDLDEVEDNDDPADLLDRAPIVTIMGHVDHGKTSLLDYIREANVVAGEKGGITQHIGAYEVILENGKKIAFLDTPGHEAFTAMRARGAKVTDIAVIIVAADDSVMPQTKEAISHSQAAGVPMVFAINKVDKENANADRIKEQLSQMNILLEDWGGKFQSQEVSAKTGLNVPELLEKILLEAEMLELKANPNKNAIGTVIEASLDKGRGYVANMMVQEGTLKVGDMILSGSNYGKVKAMFNERNQPIETAGPSTPILVLGLNGAPQAGERFKVYDNEQEVKSIATKRAQIQREQGIRTQKHITLDEIGRRLALGSFKELNLIVKGDVDGSVEALTDSLLKLSTEEIQINIVHKGVGQITESDILLASASDAIIVGFQVRPSLTTRKLAEKEDIEIRLYSIIYDAIEEIKAAMEGMLEAKIEEKIVCSVEIREVFKISRVGTIAGCYVLDGKINRNTKVRIVREGIVVYTGELASLKRFKDDVKEVTSQMECGLNIANFNDIKVGDIIEGYDLVEVKRTL